MADATRYFDLSSPFAMWRGGALVGAKLAYETWGTLNEKRDNAILILTGLSPGALAPLEVLRELARSAAEDSLEWEMPGDVLDETASEAGEAAKVDSRVADDHGTAESVEDVLEETPDFLRDTPEQERLWFEQRPPRDFDFNE